MSTDVRNLSANDPIAAESEGIQRLVQRARAATVRQWLDQSDEFNWLPPERRDDLAQAVAADPNYAAFASIVTDIHAGRMPEKAHYVDTAMAIAQTADVSLPADSMVLYTSNRLDDVKAYLAAQPDKRSNHSTPAVAMLGLMETFNDKLSPLDWKDAYLPWRAVSLRYAEAAQGDVTVIADPHKDSTLWRVELPTVMASDRVPTVNGADKAAYEHRGNKAPVSVETMADFSAAAEALKHTGPRQPAPRG